MNTLERILVKDNQVSFLFGHFDTTSSGTQIRVGETQLYRRVDELTQAQELVALADTVLAAEQQRRADAEAAAEAARLAELERWNSLTPEEQAAEIAANTPPPPVPEQITPRQLRLWLVNRGIPLAAVESALPNEAARIEWEYANYFDRNNPLVAQMALLLGLDADQVFREAAVL